MSSTNLVAEPRLSMMERISGPSNGVNLTENFMFEGIRQAAVNAANNRNAGIAIYRTHVPPKLHLHEPQRHARVWELDQQFHQEQSQNKHYLFNDVVTLQDKHNYDQVINMLSQHVDDSKEYHQIVEMSMLC